MTSKIGTYIRRHHVALLALFFALAGTSYAASSALLPKNSVGSRQVRNGSLQSVDLSKKTKAALRGASGQQGLQGAQGQRGATGAQGVQGTQGVQGIQGIPGTARAYGRVAADGALTRSKNVSGATHPYTGVYCIALGGGIDASQTGLVATPDNLSDSTSTDGSPDSPQTLVEWYSSGVSCPAGQLMVITLMRSVYRSAPYVTAITNTYHDESFFFVVP
jgi:Collagen triple helix repeat (20 copies)